MCAESRRSPACGRSITIANKCKRCATWPRNWARARKTSCPPPKKLAARARELERELASAQRQLAGGASDEILAGASQNNGIRFVASRAPQELDKNALRELADSLADKLDGVAILALENEDKVIWAVKASKGAVVAGAHAGNIVKALAQITGGGGGGRPDFAQAGGKDASKIDEALNRAPNLIGV